MFKELFTEAKKTPQEILKDYGYSYERTETENKNSIWKVYKNSDPKTSEQHYSDAVGAVKKAFKDLRIVNSGKQWIKIQVTPENRNLLK